jgi:ectoine hydroxylase-related dioxygenase (phytanoyl-CoA dioxygenase family)
MMAAPRPSRDVEQVTADIREYGYGICEGVLDADTVAVAQERVLEQAEAEKRQGMAITNSVVERDDNVNQWVSFLPNKGRIFREIILKPECLDLVRFILGREAILSEYSCHITWPGNKEMGLHIDQWWLPHPERAGADYRRPSDVTRDTLISGPPIAATQAINPPVVCNLMWAFTDFTRENGATRLVPGSHLTGRNPEPGESYEAVYAEAPAGSIVVWEGRTWHASSLNTSKGPRLGATSYWGAPFCRQLINFTYGLRPEVAADLSQEERALYGFKSWSNYGWTGTNGSEWAHPGEGNLGELNDNGD